MKRLLQVILVLGLFAYLLTHTDGCRPAYSQCPDGKCSVPPQAPWVAKAVVAGNVAPDGTEIQIDLPAERHLKNKGGSDGSGLCVFTSIQHSADWQSVLPLQDFRDWMTRRPGGGYPQKVEKMIDALCKEKGVPVPDYLQ